VPPVPRTPVTAETPARSDRRRTALVGLVALGLVVAAVVGSWAYVRSQYYVGVDGDTVAIFRGVTGSVAGVHFAEVTERTDLGTERLDRLARSRVERGIVARDRPDAESIVARLEDDHPECTPADEVPSTLPTATPTPVPAPTASATPVPAPSGSSAAARPPLCPAGAS
jgi:protein phosphatase